MPTPPNHPFWKAADASFSTMKQLANSWAQKHPELKDRIERALALTGGITRGRMPYIFFVEGQGDRYMVRVNEQMGTSTCSCPDSMKGNHCKHRLATALLVAAERREKHEGGQTRLF
jgi:hypothetical protein